MKVYIGEVGDVLRSDAFTSLKQVCEDIDVSYDSALRGKRYFWSAGGTFKRIHEVRLVKIKNRGKK